MKKLLLIILCLCIANNCFAMNLYKIEEIEERSKNSVALAIVGTVGCFSTTPLLGLALLVCAIRNAYIIDEITYNEKISHDFTKEELQVPKDVWYPTKQLGNGWSMRNYW